MGNKFLRLAGSKPFVIIAAIVVVLLAAAGVAALLGAFGDRAVQDVSSTSNSTTGTLTLPDTTMKITALDSDSLGVNPTSEFKLVVGNDPEEDEIVKVLKIEPEQTFQLNKISRGVFSLRFDKALENDSIYRFTVSDKNTGAEQSWAFQTKRALNVIRSLPRDKAVQVPVDSGIEITFSAENPVEPEKYFEITPKATGRFEQHGKTLVFVPDELRESTVYTVTLKHGIGVKGSNEVLENDYTFRFQTTVPEKSNARSSFFSFSDNLYNFTPQAVPAIQIFADDGLIDTEVAVEIFSYPNAESFLNELKQNSSSPSWIVSLNNDKQYDISRLEKAASLKARIISYKKNYWNTTYLLLPSSLQEGCYLVKADVDGKTYYTQLQVNPASVYLLATRDQTLAWLNDSVSGKPLAGAEVKLDGGNPVKSGQDGLAVLSETLPKSDDLQNYYFMITPAKGLPFVAQVKSSIYQPFHGNYYNNTDVIDNYWTYLYLDKGMYMPEDTVNIWGVIKPRNGGSMEREAVLELVRYDYTSYGDENISVLTSSKAESSPNGTFTGSLKLKNYNPGSYEVRVRIGDKVFLSNYLRVMEYTKPAYKLDITADRSYMFAWEKVGFDIQASFFEGTPVKGLKLDYLCSIGRNTLADSSTPGNETLVSDISGKSKLTFIPSTSEEGWRPLDLFLNVSNKEAEEQAINESSYVTVFPKDTMIEVKAEQNDNVGQISVSANRIDLGRLKDSNNDYYSEEDYRGAPVDVPLTAKLYEKHYVARKTGNYYDYINKVRRDTYEYDEVQTLVNDYSFTTTSGKYEFSFNTDKDKSYFIEVFGQDSKGRAIKETQYLYNWSYYIPYSGNTTYSISEGNSGRLYKQGENVPVEVVRNTDRIAEGAAAAAGSNGSNSNIGSTASTTTASISNSSNEGAANAMYLFVRLKNGVIDFRISSSPKYEFAFDKEFIPNMYVKAVCFDGTNIYDAGLQQYTYDSAESRLDVSVKPDKKQYKPGDTVKLTFDIKDAQGQPCSSEVNVSVVDEAFFAVSPQSVDTLSSLYWPAVSSGVICDYLSYHSMDETGEPMAEGGEGGDMYVRKDFKDSALFLTVTSDNHGKAETSFKLPDNLTSWRVTYQAVTGDVKAGSGKLNISSKLPFFIDTIFNKTFLTGDSPSILIRASGTELAATADVSYTVTLTEEGGSSKAYKATGNAGKMAEVPLGTLSAGNYTLRAEAVSGSLKDAMERSFKVSDSLLETSKTDYVKLTDNTVLSNKAKGLTSIAFYSDDSSLLYSELMSLYWSWGQRLDQKLASKIAGEMLKEKFNETIFSDEPFDITNYQTEDGGLALLTYDSSNPALSAKMCSLAADYVDREALASYFRKLLDDSKTMPEDIAYSYWGLAALHEPVLLDIRSRLEDHGLSPQIRLTYGAALSEIGDYQGARDIYENTLKDLGRVEETFAYIETGTRDESIDATALCSLIALRINAPEKIKLFNYIRSNSTSELLVNLERLIFVRNYIKEASLDCSFTLNLDGTEKQVDLRNGKTYRLTVTSEKLASLKFSNVRGKITAASTYVVPVSEVSIPTDSNVSIDRTYKVDGAEVTSGFDRSDTIRITLTPLFGENAPDGFYEITDVLPAGFRYVSGNPGKEQSGWYPDEVTGQKVVFGYYYKKTSYTKKSVVYYAKAVSPGTYTADNAAIRHVDSSLTGFTGRIQVNVK